MNYCPYFLMVIWFYACSGHHKSEITNWIINGYLAFIFFYVHITCKWFMSATVPAAQSAMPVSIFMGKYSNHGGRRPKVDPSVNRYVVRLNDEENARFLSMFHKSGAYNTAAFIKKFSFSDAFQGLHRWWKHSNIHRQTCGIQFTLPNYRCQLWHPHQDDEGEFHRKESVGSNCKSGEKDDWPCVNQPGHHVSCQRVWCVLATD